MKGSTLLFKLRKTRRCTIERRVNRFIVEVEIGGEKFKAYLNNTGRLLEYIVKGKVGYCIEALKPRKTKYTLVAVEDLGLGAIVDTRIQVLAFEVALRERLIPWLKTCRVLKKNVKLKKSIIDFLLYCERREKLYLEVKSAVLRGGENYAMYPDCPSKRGQRQIRDLIEHVENRGSGVILFIAALPRINGFKPNKLGDPQIYSLLKEAILKGVKLKAINLVYDPRECGVYLVNPDLPIYVS